MLSTTVDNEVVKNTAYDNMFKKVDTVYATNTSELVKKLNTTQKFKKMRRKYMTMINILLPLILINKQKKILIID